MGRKPEWWKDPALVTILVAIVTGAWVVSSRIGTLADRIGNHETAVSDRFGNHETAVSDRFGKLEASVSERFGKLEASVSERFGKLEASVSERFGAVEARLAAIEARMDLLLEGLDITVTEALGFAYRRDPLTVTEPSLRAVRVTVPSRSVR